MPIPLPNELHGATQIARRTGGPCAQKILDDELLVWFNSAPWNPRSPGARSITRAAACGRCWGASSMTRPAKKPVQTPAKKTARRLPRELLVDLYAARQYLRLDTLKEVGLRMPVEVYFKDPAVAKTYSKTRYRRRVHHAMGARPSRRSDQRAFRRGRLRFDQQHADTACRLGPATELLCCARRQAVLDRKAIDLFQFHQLSVWATFRIRSTISRAASALAGGSPGRSRATA